MKNHLPKFLTLLLLALFVIYGRVIFASNPIVNTMLEIRNNISAYIMYTPDFATGFFTSGNVLAVVTGNDISGDLNHVISNNGSYPFSYMR